jgi:aminoglycoside phosphotransferase (APT) family kinase protein
MLSEQEAFQYLAGKRLIDISRAAKGDFEIESLLRRHQCFIARQEDCAYFLKAAMDSSRAKALFNEARLYGLLNGPDQCFSYVPQIIDHDQLQAILVTEWVDGKPLRELVHETETIPSSIARGVGACLGRLHSSPIPPPERLPYVSLPWIFSIHQPDLGFVNEMSVATQGLVKIIHGDEQYRDFITTAREIWRFDAVIHNDVRWDNFLVCARGDQVWLVDWELGGVGAATWDVGGVIAEFLSVWLHSIPVIPHSSTEDWAGLADIPLQTLLPALADFFESYLATNRGVVADLQNWLDKAVRFSALRLIQSAIEQSQLSSALSSYPLLALQLSMNILQSPTAARKFLLRL